MPLLPGQKMFPLVLGSTGPGIVSSLKVRDLPWRQSPGSVDLSPGTCATPGGSVCIVTMCGPGEYIHLTPSVLAMAWHQRVCAFLGGLVPV